VVVHRYPLPNEAASPTDFFSTGQELCDAVFAMRKAGLELLAIYHSHPTAAPVPSSRDLERNFYGDEVVHLIVSLAGPEPVVRGWWLGANDFHEAAWEVRED
jgi:proteasome lid subunit RPN8/RPN11